MMVLKDKWINMRLRLTTSSMLWADVGVMLSIFGQAFKDGIHARLVVHTVASIPLLLHELYNLERNAKSAGSIERIVILRQRV